MRLIDVDHEGEKLSYGEYLARYYFVHHLANDHNNEKDMKSKKYRKKSDSRLWAKEKTKIKMMEIMEITKLDKW